MEELFSQSREGEPLTQDELVVIAKIEQLENPLKNRIQIKKELDMANKEAITEVKNLIDPPKNVKTSQSRQG